MTFLRSKTPLIQAATQVRWVPSFAIAVCRAGGLG